MSPPSANPESASIDVVVVSFRCAGPLRECLESLRRERSLGRELDVVVIDNASGDGTAEVVSEEFPEFNLVVNSKNRGFAAASNQGILRGSAPLVLLLNPDARIDEHTLPPLIDALESTPAAGAVGPKLIRADGSLDHAAKRSFPTVPGAIFYFTRLDKVVPQARQYTAPSVDEGRVDAINGAFMLIRRRALDQIGLLDEGYWMYMEDLDLCHRLADCHWQVLYVPRSVAWHLKGASAGPLKNTRLIIAFHYGMFRFYKKFRAQRANSAQNAVVYLGIAAKCAASLLASGVLRALDR